MIGLMGKPTEADFAWAAGIVDGEGYVTMRKQLDKQRGKSYTHPQITVNMTHEPTIRRLHELFGVGAFAKLNKSPGLESRKQAWRWSAVCKHAGVVANMIVPYSLTKRGELEAIVAYYASRP